MHIVIDARMLQESGIGRYTRNLLSHLSALDQKNSYSVLILSKNINSISLGGNFKKIPADFKWYSASEQVKLPLLLSKLKPDLVHFPHFNVPIFYRGKFVVTIHDLIHQNFAMRRASTRDPLTYRVKQIGYNTVLRFAVKNSKRIITPSKFVQKQLAGKYKISNSKIIVTYEGVDDGVTSIANHITQVKMTKLLEELNINKPFIFYIGNAHPHKNVEKLIEVFLLLRESYPDLTLVLSGNDHYFWQRIKAKHQHEGIIFTGFVSDEQMVALYKAAMAYVLPSLEEGFGIPLLEAMAMGCPVVSSNAGSLPEVGKDAAIYFDPKNSEDMKQKISQVLDSQKLRQDLIKKGKKHQQQFSWQKMAVQTLAAYNAV